MLKAEKRGGIVKKAKGFYKRYGLEVTDFLFVAEYLQQNGIIQSIPDYLEFHAPF